MFRLTARKVIDSVFRAYDWLFPPPTINRSEEENKRLAKSTSGLALYDYKGCMASRKARHEILRLNLDIERRDIGKCSIHQDNLLAEFGELKAPCLRVEEKGEVQWIDEPEKILVFLHDRFADNDEKSRRQISA